MGFSPSEAQGLQLGATVLQRHSISSRTCSSPAGTGQVGAKTKRLAPL